jgi:M6 family metalloprotease-like protein
MKTRFLIFLCIISGYLIAAPYNGQIMQFKQPDGTFVDLKLYGTEYYIRAEGLDNLTVVRDKNTNWICYADLSADGSELISNGIVYKGKKDDISSLRADLKLPKHLDISEKVKNSIILKNQQRLGFNIHHDRRKTEPYPVSGNIRGLCIIVDFSDEVGTLPKSEFTNFCNNLTYSNFGNNGSLRTYYSDISGGLVDYQNVVYGYFRAPKTFAEYEAMENGVGAREILGLALSWIESLGFDFSTLSINPDGTIEAINLMYTGQAQTWSKGMWWHQGYYTDFSADGVHSGAYNCSPANNPLSLGTVCHENGHMIGKWPDTYKYDGNTGPDGIGAFDLMCNEGDMYNPVPPNPHFWSNAGWGKMVNVTYINGTNSDTANSLTCYKHINPYDTNEFFLIENRSQTGRSASIPDQGLTIWHINRMGDNQTAHHEVYLVHANNNIVDHYNACFHSGFNNEYGIATTPNSLLFDGNPSGLRVWNISTVKNIMTYKLGAGVPAPIFTLSYENVSGDSNGNGFLEPGETGNINIKASNFGQLNSGNSTITCTSVGANASLVTVNNTSVNTGIIQVSKSAVAAFNVSIAANTTIATEIEIKFKISDGTDSTYLTKKLVIGEQIIIGNLQITNCSAIFYDSGGSLYNYSNMQDFTTTFHAISASEPVKVEFLTFGLEEEPNCEYDYLKIYNGPFTTSPLIGTYCGTNLPATVRSTHPTGALTFKFHSDEYVTGIGWSAIISCSSVNEISGLNSNAKFDIYPVPFIDNTVIEFNLNNTNNSRITIVDIFGRPVMEYAELNESKIVLKREDFQSGIFFVQLWDGLNLLGTKKLVVL